MNKIDSIRLRPVAGTGVMARDRLLASARGRVRPAGRVCADMAMGKDGIALPPGFLPSDFILGSDQASLAILPAGHVHEIYAPDPEDMGSASAFALLMAHRARMVCRAVDDRPASPLPILWVRECGTARKWGHVYPPGLSELGIGPDDILYVDTDDSLSLLRSVVEGLGCAAFGAVIADLSSMRRGRWDLTASRRLVLAARRSGVTALCFCGDADPVPSAAYSRWQVAAAPSSMMEAMAPGNPAFDIRLLRHRGGVDGLHMQVEWNRDGQFFQNAPGIGATHRLSEIGTHIAAMRRRA